MRSTLSAGIVLLALATACSRATRQTVAQSGESTDLDPAQCAALADSIGRLPLQKRPLTQPESRSGVSISPPPRGSSTSSEVRIDFAVGTDGLVEDSTITVDGAPPSVRSELISSLTGKRFRVVRRRGCAVPARGQLRLRTFTVRRSP